MLRIEHVKLLVNFLTETKSLDTEIILHNYDLPVAIDALVVACQQLT